MAGSFFDSFNAALPSMEASFTEDWIFNGTTYPAIAVDESEGHTITMKGGEIDTTSVKAWVRLEVFEASGVTEDDVITIRGRDYLLRSISDVGDACKEFECTSPQIDLWGK